MCLSPSAESLHFFSRIYICVFVCVCTCISVSCVYMSVHVCVRFHVRVCACPSGSQRTASTILCSPSVVCIPGIEFIGRPPVLAMASAFTCWDNQARACIFTVSTWFFIWASPVNSARRSK